MLELLMTAGKAANVNPEPDVIFLWDPGQAKDLIGSAATVAYVGSTSIDETNTIDGHPTYLIPGTTSGVTITFETPLDLSGTDWTLEWSTWNAAAATNYAGELALYSGATANGILARWGDAGFGSRLQFGNKFAAATDCWNIGLSKSGSVGTINAMAMVCKSGVITIYRNGVKQGLANGTGSTYGTPSYTALSSAYVDLRTIRLGWLNSTVTANAGRRGRIRICRNALYTANYTPQPF